MNSLTDLRIGHGYDVHRLTEGRPLVLGGVTIPYEKGLLGHSDADVLLHALMDALLGAMGEGDIGRHFPDSDMQYKGISSMLLLRYVFGMMQERKYKLINADITVLAERPKLLPYVAAMRTGIADALDASVDAVNIKATTEEGLGFTGKGEGIAAHAVCLLLRDSK